MVRRAVAIKIGEIAQFMDKNHVINDLIPIQRQLCQDEQVSLNSPASRIKFACFAWRVWRIWPRF